MQRQRGNLPKSTEMSDDEKYRLNNLELNEVLAALAKKKSPQPYAHEKFFPVIHAGSGRKFYICPTSIDSATNASGVVANKFWKTVYSFLKTHENERGCTLLIPLYLCRYFAMLPPSITPSLLQRQHIVLLEVNLETLKMSVHDSQSALKWALYPDKIPEILNEFNHVLEKKYDIRLSYHPLKSYHTYNMQESTFDCGYFVFAYISHILTTGSTVGLEDIRVSAKRSFNNKGDFLQRKLGKRSLQSEETHADDSSQSKIEAIDDFELDEIDTVASQRNAKKESPQPVPAAAASSAASSKETEKKASIRPAVPVSTTANNFELIINRGIINIRQARALRQIFSQNPLVQTIEPNKRYYFEDHNFSKQRCSVQLTYPLNRYDIRQINPASPLSKDENELVNKLIDEYMLNDSDNSQKLLSSECVYTVNHNNLICHVRLTASIAAYRSRKHKEERYAVEVSPLGGGSFANVGFSNLILIRKNRILSLHEKKSERQLVLKTNYGSHQFGAITKTAEEITRNEALLFSRLDRPKIKGVASDRANNQSVIIERFIPGMSLWSFIQTPVGQRNSINKLIHIRAKLSRMLFEELKKIHSKNIVHRDIKPENVIIEFEFKPGIASIYDVKSMDDIVDVKKVTIIDGGLAKDSAINDVGECVGSPAYASIESYQAAGTTDKTDNDAMARVLWYLWGSYHLSNARRIPDKGIAFFLQPQKSIPGLFEHFPLSDTELSPYDKRRINDLLIKYHHVDKSQRPTEDAAIELFAELERKYNPQPAISSIQLTK